MRRIAAATRKLVEAGNRSERPNTSTGKITRETGRYRTSGIGRLDRTGKMRRGESDRSPQGRLSAKATGRHNRLTNSPKTGRAAREGNGSDRQKTRPPTKRKRNLAASGALQAAEPTDKSQQIAIAIVAGLLGLLFVVIAALFLMSK